MKPFQSVLYQNEDVCQVLETHLFNVTVSHFIVKVHKNICDQRLNVYDMKIRNYHLILYLLSFASLYSFSFCIKKNEKGGDDSKIVLN